MGNQVSTGSGSAFVQTGYYDSASPQEHTRSKADLEVLRSQLTGLGAQLRSEALTRAAGGVHSSSTDEPGSLGVANVDSGRSFVPSAAGGQYIDGKVMQDFHNPRFGGEGSANAVGSAWQGNIHSQQQNLNSAATSFQGAVFSQTTSHLGVEDHAIGTGAFRDGVHGRIAASDAPQLGGLGQSSAFNQRRDVILDGGTDSHSGLGVSGGVGVGDSSLVPARGYNVDTGTSQLHVDEARIRQLTEMRGHSIDTEALQTQMSRTGMQHRSDALSALPSASHATSPFTRF